MSPTIADLLLAEIDGALAVDAALPETLGIDPGLVREAVVELLPTLLDATLAEIIGGAWKTLAALRSFADRGKHPPDEVNLVPLATHAIESEHHPRIEIRVSEALVHTLVFDVRVGLELEGACAVVQDGRIRAIRSGRVIGRGSIGIAGVVLVQRASKPIDLPGTLELGQGIEIG